VRACACVNVAKIREVRIQPASSKIRTYTCGTEGH